MLQGVTITHSYRTRAPSDLKMKFSLHPALARDTVPISRLGGTRLLLMNDSRFIWCVLVPEYPGLRELHELPQPQRSAFLELVCQLSANLHTAFDAEKMNVAALGNRVPQLHVHIVVRHSADAAWPDPVWGVGAAVPWETSALAEVIPRVRGCAAALDSGPQSL